MLHSEVAAALFILLTFLQELTYLQNWSYVFSASLCVGCYERFRTEVFCHVNELLLNIKIGFENIWYL